MCHWKPYPSKAWLVIPFLSLVLLAVACGAAATPTPTPIAAPAPTDKPTTLAVAVTPSPVLIPTATPTSARASTPGAPATPPKVSRLKIAVTPPPHETNDPFQTTLSGQWQLTPMYETLLRVTPTGEIVPMLATDYAMSPDAKTWTINLKKGVRWRGNWGEFTAKDLVHTLRAITKDGSLTGRAAEWRTLLELPNKTDRITVVSDYQFKLQLAKPEPNLQHLLSSGNDLYMLSAAQFDSEGPEGWTRKPVGTGPYEFVERKPGQSLLYKRAEGKHWRVTPDFDELQLLFVPEDATRFAMLLTREAHIAEVSPDLEREASLKGMKVILSTLPNNVSVLAFGGNYLPTAPQYKPDVPWTKKSVREAMNRAVNRTELRDSLFGGRGDLVMVDRMHPSVPGWNPEWPKQFEKNYGYDPARAKALLKEAGYPQGFKVNLAVAPRPGLPQIFTLAEAIANYWQAIGVDAKVTQYEYATIRDQARKLNQYDPYFNVGPFVLNPASGIANTFYSKLNPPHHYFNSSLIDQKMEEFSAAVDLGVRDRALRDVGDVLFSEYAALPLFWTNASLVIDSRVVAEYTFSGVPYAPSDMEYIRAAR